MFLAHGPISYILNEHIQKKKIAKLNKQEHLLVMILSLIFGILPDIDLAILSMTNIPPFQHHLIFTHSILFYLSLWILLNILLYGIKSVLNKESRKAFNDRLISVIQWSFLIGTLSHLFADVLFSYSRIFFPLEQQITILGNLLKSNYFTGYLLTPSFATEILAVFIFLLLIFKKYIKEVKIVKYFIYLLISLSLIYLLFAVYMNLHTYNKAYHFQNNVYIRDADFDGVEDSYDSDTNNNIIKNIFEADRSELVNFVKEISTEKYLVTNSNDSFGKIKYDFGAFNSYRLISQAYFEQNLPIEPVLIEYAKETYTIQSYDMNISYPKLLYEFLQKNGTFKDFEIGIDAGRIFFVTKDPDVVNMGIVLDGDSFGIVLPNDTRLVTHSLKEILEIYPEASIKVSDLRFVSNR